MTQFWLFPNPSPLHSICESIYSDALQEEHKNFLLSHTSCDLFIAAMSCGGSVVKNSIKKTIDNASQDDVLKELLGLLKCVWVRRRRWRIQIFLKTKNRIRIGIEAE